MVVDKGHATLIERRRARKQHRCGWGYCRTIEVGELYLVHTSFPGHDSGYASDAGRPVRSAECSDCASRYDRGHFLHDPA